MGNEKDKDVEPTATNETTESPQLELVEETLDVEAPSAEEIFAQALADTEARLKTVSAAYKGMQEEMAALKERTERQRGVQRELMKGELVRSLFEPLQNLRRSGDALNKAEVENDLVKGLDMVVRDFQEAFSQLGLEEIAAEGRPFNPEVHEALSIVPVLEKAQAGMVLEVFSAGYRIGSCLLAPAKVVIGKYEEPVSEA